MVTDRTNILLITSDQQHWNTLGINNLEIQTPNLDRLANFGTTFNRTYCPNLTCTPTRASIATGQYPSQHGAYSLGAKLLEDSHTVGEDFLQSGYRTSLVGKAHFQPLRESEEFSSLESTQSYKISIFGVISISDSIALNMWNSHETILMKHMSDNTMLSGWKRKGAITGEIPSSNGK